MSEKTQKILNNSLIIFGSVLVVGALMIQFEKRTRFSCKKFPARNKWFDVEFILDIEGRPTLRPRFNGKMAYMPKPYNDYQKPL